jgi:hypothetical protein
VNSSARCEIEVNAHHHVLALNNDKLNETNWNNDKINETNWNQRGGILTFCHCDAQVNAMRPLVPDPLITNFVRSGDDFTTALTCSAKRRMLSRKVRTIG